MISNALATTLRSGRPDFNARFAEARQRFPGLNVEMFSAVLREMVDPLVAAVAAIRPDCVAETVSVAYDAALELTGQNLAGPGVRSMAIVEGLRGLLPVAAHHLAEAPASVLPAVSNALHHLATTPGARPAQWVRDLARLAGQCRTADEFLKLGQTAAWRAGLAHYRPAALALLDSLPEHLTLALLEIPEPHPQPGLLPDDPLNGPDGEGKSRLWKEVRGRLDRDPWYDPSKPENGVGRGAPLRPVRRVGAFRGFGGLFIEPPLVMADGNAILVRSGDECWLLTADCFGATFHRSDSAQCAAAARQKALPAGIEVAGTTIRRNGFSLKLEQLGSISSIAAIADTLAITSPLTHAVLLVAMT